MLKNPPCSIGNTFYHLHSWWIFQLVMLVFGGGYRSKLYTPWKINGWNIQITHLERKWIWTKPAWGHVPAVNLQGCIISTSSSRRPVRFLTTGLRIHHSVSASPVRCAFVPKVMWTKRNVDDFPKKMIRMWRKQPIPMDFFCDVCLRLLLANEVFFCKGFFFRVCGGSSASNSGDG